MTDQHVGPTDADVEVAEGEAVEPGAAGHAERDVVAAEAADVEADSIDSEAGSHIDAGADADDDADARLDRLDEGGSAVAEALPFDIPAREHFAAVDAVESTGDARVDAATARLDEVAELPTADHVEVYEDVHHRLQDALSEAEVR